jgi:hypothetical protein
MRLCTAWLPVLIAYRGGAPVNFNAPLEGMLEPSAISHPATSHAGFFNPRVDAIERM